MKAYLYFFLAALFLHWIIEQQEEPEILRNALYALGAMVGFILVCLGVFELCGCVM